MSSTFKICFRNVNIHIIFIPIIMFTLMGFWQMSPKTFHTKIDLGGFSISQGNFEADPTKHEIILNTHFMFLGTLSMVYLMVEPFIGFLSASLLAILYTLGTYLISFDQEIFGGSLFKIMLVVHIFAWTTQFVGHGIYESK